MTVMLVESDEYVLLLTLIYDIVILFVTMAALQCLNIILPFVVCFVLMIGVYV